jgi:hypothetical protein
VGTTVVIVVLQINLCSSATSFLVAERERVKNPNFKKKKLSCLDGGSGVYVISFLFLFILPFYILAMRLNYI